MGRLHDTVMPTIGPTRGKSVPGRPSLTVGRPTWFQKGGTGVPPRPEMLGRRPGLCGPWMLWNYGRKALHTLLLLEFNISYGRRVSLTTTQKTSGNQRRKIRPTCLQKGGTGKISVPPTQVGQSFGWVPQAAQPRNCLPVKMLSLTVASSSSALGPIRAQKKWILSRFMRVILAQGPS